MRKGKVPNNSSGVVGELVAAKELQAHGFEILCRNYHTRFGEIDIIVKDSLYIIFVEVKTRETGSLSHPFEAITSAKQKKIILAAQDYLQNNPSNLQPRFDAIAVITEKGKVESVTHLENAFMA
ncbi:YraN family protein [Scatolibacter rhodanostii]|uniref:YraN family protein n=1 Tax=Scatolibacter rhodanostii TaxID=2014781 RepID=UPI000C08A656|nr:YraN family protein [Scatolibacter rhodanostii]